MQNVTDSTVLPLATLGDRAQIGSTACYSYMQNVTESTVLALANLGDRAQIGSIIFGLSCIALSVLVVSQENFDNIHESLIRNVKFDRYHNINENENCS
jgi:hypothetical protein